MEAERWQKIEEVFHRALQSDPARRGAILDEMCGTDVSLRNEVESSYRTTTKPTHSSKLPSSLP